MQLNLTEVLKLPERLRNFILCTKQNDELTMGIIRQGAPHLFTESEEISYPVPWTAVLIRGFGRLPNGGDLSGERHLEEACAYFNIPSSLVITYWSDEDCDQLGSLDIDYDRDYYQELGILVVLTLRQWQNLPRFKLGDVFTYAGNEHVVVGLDHAQAGAYFAPAARIDLDK